MEWKISHYFEVIKEMSHSKEIITDMLVREKGWKVLLSNVCLAGLLIISISVWVVLKARKRHR